MEQKPYNPHASIPPAMPSAQAHADRIARRGRVNGWRPLTERTAEEYARRARPAADSPESEPAGREDRAAERRAEVVDAETRKAIRAGQVAREALREAYRSGGGDAA